MQPETSSEAHENIKPKKSIHHKWIMEAMELAGKPLTAGEIRTYINRPGIDKTAVSRRTKEMEVMGLIRRGDARACTCRWCDSRQLTWSIFTVEPEQGNLFDASPIKKW